MNDSINIDGQIGAEIEITPEMVIEMSDRLGDLEMGPLPTRLVEEVLRAAFYTMNPASRFSFHSRSQKDGVCQKEQQETGAQ